jgi:hypothetical protein
MSEDLFTTYERLDTRRCVEVTEDNIHILAKHFGWAVDYSGDGPVMWHDGETGTRWKVEVGAWVDHRGSRWNPEPLTQGWHPEGTYRTTEPTTEGASDDH